MKIIWTIERYIDPDYAEANLIRHHLCANGETTGYGVQRVGTDLWELTVPYWSASDYAKVNHWRAARAECEQIFLDPERERREAQAK